MKDSGVAWIGVLPSAWGIYRFKDAGNFQTGRDHKILNEGRIPVYGSSREPFAYVDRMLCKRKAIAIGRKGTIDQPFVIQDGFWAVDTCMFHTVLKKNFSLDYLGYWAEIVPWREMSTQAALPSLTQTDANNAIVGYPPLPEQHTIADYLDRQTALIDQRLSTLAEKKVVLAELRKATIHEAVTKGLHKTAAMKDSGMAWVGRVPTSWVPNKVGTSFLMGSGTTPPTGEQQWYDGAIPWVQTSELRENVIFETSKSVSVEAINKFSALRLYKSGSVLVAMYGATIGRVGMLGINAATNQACCVLTERIGIMAAFAFWWFQGMRDELIERGNGGGQPNISQSVIAGLRIFAPNKEEQLSIARHLDQQTQHIDDQLATLDEQAQLLKELRKAIIHEAVTGKIDVGRDSSRRVK